MQKIMLCIVLLGATSATLPPLTALDVSPAAPPERRKTAVSIWGGYATAAMNDVNNAIKNLGPDGTVSEIKDGYSLAAELLFEVAPRFSVGPRLEYVSLNQGRSSSPSLLNYRQTLYLVPVMAGGRYAFIDNGAWNLSAGLFLGAGFGYGSTKNTVSVSPALETETKYDGSAFAGNLLIGGRYALGQNTFLGIDLGYRLARIARMQVTGTSTHAPGNNVDGSDGGLYAPAVGTPQDTTGNDLAYDFSGLVANAGLTFRF